MASTTVVRRSLVGENPACSALPCKDARSRVDRLLYGMHCNKYLPHPHPATTANPGSLVKINWQCYLLTLLVDEAPAGGFREPKSLSAERLQTRRAAPVSSGVAPPWLPSSVMPWSPRTKTTVSSSTPAKTVLGDKKKVQHPLQINHKNTESNCPYEIQYQLRYSVFILSVTSPLIDHLSFAFICIVHQSQTLHRS